MNAIFKTIFLLGAAGAAVFFGLQTKQKQELEGLKREEATALGSLKESVNKRDVLQARLEAAKSDSMAGDALMEKFNQSTTVLEAERKRTTELLAEWSKVDADRAAAVKAVRAKEPTRTPVALTLADGTKLLNCIIRSVPDEKTVSLEHSGGLIKVPAEKLPEEIRSRLGMGWRVDPPAMLDFDRQGHFIARETPGDGAPEQLNLDTLDMSSLTAVVKSLALVETYLSKTMAALTSEKAMLRKHTIFKPEVIAEGTGKTYRELKEESNLRLASLASRVEALQAARGNLQKKLKTS